ncbi:uncharacterized protein [Triticum aestivum]|uniref:uncharacterized protein n=1 Tax=Triticum aestivum TaxID=4565 RepID=UPI001D02EED4|nr:uncharacterized protein LOC123155877 [Triticum aestivum]
MPAPPAQPPSRRSPPTLACPPPAILWLTATVGGPPVRLTVGARPTVSPVALGACPWPVPHIAECDSSVLHTADNKDCTTPRQRRSFSVSRCVLPLRHLWNSSCTHAMATDSMVCRSTMLRLQNLQM